MPDASTPVVHLHENSVEQVAYKLFLHIVQMAQVSLAPGHGKVAVDMRWVLSTYAECLKAVRFGTVDCGPWT